MPFRRENLHLIHFTITAKLLRSRILRPILAHDTVLLSASDHAAVNLVNISSIRDPATGDGRHETTRTNHIGNRGRVKNPTIRIQILRNSRAPMTRHPRDHTLKHDHITMKQIPRNMLRSSLAVVNMPVPRLLSINSHLSPHNRGQDPN